MTPSAFFAAATFGSISSAVTELLLGARRVAAIEPDFAHLVPDERILWIDRQVVFEPRQRRVVVSELRDRPVQG